MIRVVFSSVAVAIVLGGCSSGGKNAVCDAIESPPTLVSPANGSTGFPDSGGTIALTGGAEPITITPSGGGTPIQISASNASGLANTTYPTPTLAPTTLYTITVLISDCGGSRNVTLGSFTTQ